MQPLPVGPIDMHVHIVGNGTGGTGCWMRVRGWHRPLALFMLRHIGLPTSALQGDLDGLYARRLAELAEGSSLAAIVILAHDWVYNEKGERLADLGSVHVPNNYVLKLARENRKFLPAVSIHPGRADALEELNRCSEAGAVMMKCLPNCHNIDCNNRRYTRFWERMAELGMPLLAHTGGEHTVEVVRPELADPAVLQLPLECGVTVIAAHCATKSGLFDPDYFLRFAKMIRKYPRLYGDNSAFNVPVRGRHIPECLVEPLRGRILHGSDFPVPVSGRWAWMNRLIDWNTFRKWDREPNVLERDYQLKRALGFPEESFHKIASLLPGNSANSGKDQAASLNAKG